MHKAEDDNATATAQLLWAACRPAADVAAVHDAIDRGADVKLAAGVAVVGRTGPLLWRTLDDAGLLDTLGSIRDAVQADYDMRRVQAALLLPLAVARAIEPLTGAGLEPVIFKGPVVAARYPSPGLRPMDDIDVLLPPEEHQQGVALLEAAGWKRYERDGDHYDTVLTHATVPGLALELHQGLDSWRDRTNRLTSMDLWRARVPVDCMGTAAYSVPPEMELLALAAHAGKPYHTFQRLIWSVDFAVVIGAAGEAFDWDALARQSEAASCRTVIAVALRHARRLGAEVPDELLALRGGRYRQAALAPVVDEQWPVLFPDAGQVHRLRYALWDAWTRQALLMLGEITRDGVLRVPQRLAYVLWQGLRRGLRGRRPEPTLDIDVSAPQSH